jgi:hypothetical protein
MEDDEEISKRKRQNLIDKMRQARGKTKPRAPRFVPEIEPEEDPSMVVFRRDFPEEWILFGGELPLFVSSWDLLYKHCKAAYKRACKGSENFKECYRSATAKRAKSKRIDCVVELMTRIFTIFFDERLFFPSANDELQMQGFEQFLDSADDMNERHWAYPYMAVFIKAQRKDRRSNSVEATYKRVASGEIELFSRDDVELFSRALARKSMFKEFISAMVEDIALQYRCNSIIPVAPEFRAIFNSTGLWTVPSMKVYAEDFMRVFTYVEAIDVVIPEQTRVLIALHFRNLIPAEQKYAENRLKDVLATIERMKREPALKFVESHCIQCSAPAQMVLADNFAKAFCSINCLKK